MVFVPPAALWQRIRLTSSEPGGQAARQQITARTDRFDAATGFPLAARTARGGRLATAAMAAVVVLLLLLGGYAGMRLLDTGEPAATTVGTGPTATGAAPTGPATTPAPVATTPSPSPPPTTAGPVETTAAAPGPAGTPSASSSPGPSPTASATGSPAPPPFSVTAEASTRCGGTVSAPTFYLVVTATATGGTFASADLYWSVPRASRPQWMSMTLSGTTAHTRVDRIAGTTVTWWVNAVSDTGEKVSTGMTATTVDCPAGG